MDTGSSINVLYKATLGKIDLGIIDTRACATTLYGFSGEGIVSVGVVSLPVTFGEYPLSMTKIIEFIVVDTLSAYNVLLGRLALVELGAVTSVRNLAMKFPTPRGVSVSKGDQLTALECYSISTRGNGKAATQALVLIDEIEAGGETGGTPRAGEAPNVNLRIGVEEVDMEPMAGYLVSAPSNLLLT